MGLNPDLAGWQRRFAVAGVGLMIFAAWRIGRVRGWTNAAWLRGVAWVAVELASAVALAGAGATFSTVFIALAGCKAVSFTTISGAAAIAVTVLLPVAVLTPASLDVTAAVPVVIALVIAIIFFALLKHRQRGVFLSFFLIAMILACLIAPNLLGHSLAA